MYIIYATFLILRIFHDASEHRRTGIPTSACWGVFHKPQTVLFYLEFYEMTP